MIVLLVRLIGNQNKTSETLVELQKQIILDQNVDFTGNTNTYYFQSFNIQVNYGPKKRKENRNLAQYIHFRTGIIT